MSSHFDSGKRSISDQWHYIYISCVCPIFMLFTVSGVGIYPIYNHVYYQQLLYSFLKFQIPLTSLFPFHGIFWGVPRKKTKKTTPPEMSGSSGRDRVGIVCFSPEIGELCFQGPKVITQLPNPNILAGGEFFHLFQACEFIRGDELMDLETLVFCFYLGLARKKPMIQRV